MRGAATRTDAEPVGIRRRRGVRLATSRVDGQGGASDCQLHESTARCVRRRMAGAGEAFGAAGPSPSGSGAPRLRRTTEKVEHQTRRHQTRRGRERGQGGELCLLAQALTGTRVAIELRDDTMLKGTILSATEAMECVGSFSRWHHPTHTQLWIRHARAPRR